MSATPTDLETQLYLSLYAMPCRCEFERNAMNVPTWHPQDNTIQRKLIKRCSRCAATEAYEKKYHHV